MWSVFDMDFVICIQLLSDRVVNSYVVLFACPCRVWLNTRGIQEISEDLLDVL